MPSSRLWLACCGVAAAVLAASLALSPAAGPSGAASGQRVNLRALTPAQLAGQRVIYSYRGLTPPARLLWLISHGQAAGVIFFGENIAGHAQLRAVTRRLERANASPHNPVRAPLLLLTDQEGGRIRRLSGPPLLNEKQVGMATDPESAAAAAGAGAARNLASVGVNVNLAPVLDVYRAPGDFIDQYGRSYSMEPAVVSDLAAAFIGAQQGGGVAATAKHFPGLGAARLSQDTDLRPVTLDVPRSSLRAVDELPYKAAIARGVRLVMLSWALYPALDARRPAGLSRLITEGELRERLGFTGVTLTDALEAGALKPFGTIAHRSILAARAGTDLMLCSHRRVGQGERASAALQHGYLDGTLDKAAFRASVRRIVALRQALGG